MNWKESRWTDILYQFGNGEVSLNPGHVHFLGDVLPRAAQIMTYTLLDLSNVQGSKMSLPFKFTSEYEFYQAFWQIVGGLGRVLQEDEVQKDRKIQLLPLLYLQQELQIYGGK